jgi:uncharacterized protein (DUF2336 family)
MTILPFTDSASNPNDGSMLLSQEDVERLLRDDSPDSCRHVLTKVANQYNQKTLTPSEQEIAEHIFRLLMRDLSTRVRETLAEHMKDNADAPRDIVLHLAHDVEPVATPVLEKSKVLSDADLVTIVEGSSDKGKLTAISRREHVSSRVSSALIETHYAEVLTTLLHNHRAEISTQDLGKIATDFADDGSVIQALAEHPNLPMVVVERIISKASDAVASSLKEKYNLSDQAVGAGALKVREEYILRLLQSNPPQHELEALVTQMSAEGTLSPSLLMTTLCRGQLAFFTAALAAIANVPFMNAERLLLDRGEHGFVGIYRKSELPESMMEAIRLVLHAVQDLEGGDVIPGTAPYGNRLVERILRMAGTQDIEYLPYFIALVRRNVGR